MKGEYRDKTKGQLINELEQLRRQTAELERSETERKLAEKMLQTAHGELERRVEERTAELARTTQQLKLELSERKRLEHELRQSEEKYRTITATAQDAIIMMDNEGNISYWNPAAERMFGYATKEAIGKELHIFLGPRRHHEAYKKGFKKFQETGQGVAVGKTLELSAIRKDGTEFPIELSVSGIQIEGKWHATGIVRDITKRKQAEEALREASDQLERQVEERTAELLKANEQLKREIDERKRAEVEKERVEAHLIRAQKLEAIGTLAGGIAHDFNNLLMGIQGNVSLILMDMDPTDPNFPRLHNIEKQVQSGARLTLHLLGYARKGKYEVSPVNLNRLVQDTADTFGRTRREITIHRELAEDLFAVEADAGQIEQVLLNLFINGADAMPGGGDLILKTTNTTHKDMKGKLYKPKPGKYALLTVVDTGMGMDSNTMGRIFDPFFTTKEMGRGTGLGLASAYGIIKAHGGYIDVDSRRGNGATFRIYLPASEKTVSKPVKSDRRPTQGNETLLLADDEPIILAVGRQLLEAMGYRVIVARDGKEALDVYRKNRDEIDIVILDMIMPNMGGGEAYDRMKEINPDIKVLLSSGYSIDGEAAEILERGCNDFIQKPFNEKDLSRKIREILDE